MNFRKIDEDTVRCIVSEDDMKEYGLGIEDFFTNKEKSQAFLEKIVEKAQEEVGYQAKSGMVTMQVMPLPMNGLAITFTDNGDNSLKNMMDHIKEATGILDQLKDTASTSSTDEKARVFDKFMKNFLDTDVSEELGPDTMNTSVKKKNKRPFMFKIFYFANLNHVEQYCDAVVCEKVITSRLFKETNHSGYYLVIHKGRLSADTFREICENALEYAEWVSDNPIKLAYCEEHSMCIIKKKAVNVLKGLSSSSENPL